MKPFLRTLFRLSFLAFFIVSCEKAAGISDDGGEGLSSREKSVRSAVRYFANAVVDTYYLWNDEVAGSWRDWREYDEPVAAFRKLRFKDGAGADIDRWSMLTDDYSSLSESFSGVETTYGYDFRFYYSEYDAGKVEAVVTYVYKDSPASEAGLERGDAVVLFDGQYITESNYKDIASKMLNSQSCTLSLRNGATVSMSARKMYEDPVVCCRILESNGRKIAYLHYTSFTMQSVPVLADAFAFFRSRGAEDLVLDLRYNGGGYVNAELALASMIVPESELSAGSIHTVDIYNDILAESWGRPERRFSPVVEYTGADGKTHTLDISASNCDFRRMAVIFTESSASASEGLVTGLAPYMDITVVGSQSHGKYCSGVLMRAGDWYESMREYMPVERYSAGMEYCPDWGIYLMIGRYADKNGETPCMPDGFVPDINIGDAPYDGRPLGDPDEQMLKAAISALSGVRGAMCPSAGGTAPRPVGFNPRGGKSGLRIDATELPGMLNNCQK